MNGLNKFTRNKRTFGTTVYHIKSFYMELHDNSGDSGKKLFSGLATIVESSRKKLQQRCKKYYVTIKAAHLDEIRPGYYRKKYSPTDGEFLIPAANPN